MPFFKLIKFYSRQQGNTTFNFYVSKDKQLIAEVIHNEKTQQLQIDISRDLQFDLSDEKTSKLRMTFDQSYFGVQVNKVLVNARGLGGWNEDVHKGYEDVPIKRYTVGGDVSTNFWTINQANFRTCPYSTGDK